VKKPTRTGFTTKTQKKHISQYLIVENIQPETVFAGKPGQFTGPLRFVTKIEISFFFTWKK
jgi:hypothetical protein